MKGDAGMFMVEEDGVHAVTFVDYGGTRVERGVLTLDLLLDVEVLDGDED